MIKSKYTNRFHSEPQFNMTSMIDVVFLLIIFFMLACQYIVQENYKLVIPDDCTAAIVPERLDRNAITVSVFPKNAGTPGNQEILYAVRAREYDPQQEVYRREPLRLVEEMSRQITTEAQRKEDALIYLRADKDLTYGQVQKAMLALSRAQIRKVQLAAYSGNQIDKTGSESKSEE